MKKFFKNNKGFTMVELIIVIAIIAVLAAVLAPQYLRFVEDSRESTDVDTAAKIETTLNVLIAADDITYSAVATNNTVTWTVATGALAFGSGLQGPAVPTTTNPDVFFDQLNADGAADLAVSSVNAKAATTVVFTVSEDALGNPSVTSNVDYDDWAD